MPFVKEWLETAVVRHGATTGDERGAAAHDVRQRRFARGRAVHLEAADGSPAGIVCPIATHGEVLGVLALEGPIGTHETGHQDFVAAVAGVLGEAINQRRMRRRLALEREASSLLAQADTLGAVGTGLSQALRPHQVDDVEIDVVRGEANERWERLYPEGTGAERASPSSGMDGSSSPVFIRTASGGEVLVAAERGAKGRCRLRLRGANLHAPDPALAEGLSFVAQLLAGFLDRA